MLFQRWEAILHGIDLKGQILIDPGERRI